MAFPTPPWAVSAPAYPSAVTSYGNAAQKRGGGDNEVGGSGSGGADMELPESRLPGKSHTAKKRAALRAKTFDALVSGVVKLSGLPRKEEKKKEKKKKHRRKKTEASTSSTSPAAAYDDEQKKKRKEPPAVVVAVAVAAAPAAPAPHPSPPPLTDEQRRLQRRPSKRNKYAALAAEERAAKEKREEAREKEAKPKAAKAAAAPAAAPAPAPAAAPAPAPAGPLPRPLSPPPKKDREDKRKKGSKKTEDPEEAAEGKRRPEQKKKKTKKEKQRERKEKEEEAEAPAAVVPPAAAVVEEQEGEEEREIEEEKAAATTAAATTTATTRATATRAAPLSLPLALRSRKPAPPSSPDPLAKHRARLAGGAFRSLNEALYSRPGAASAALLASTPGSFEQYHQGFRAATEAWPELPVERAARDLLRRFSDADAAAAPGAGSAAAPRLVVDFGCGEAWLGRTLERRGIRCLSLDLVSTAPDVVACDVSAGTGAVPLENSSADAAVFCLALMSTDYPEALSEAARVLRPGGTLWVAEVRSRFAGGKGGRGGGSDGDDGDESDDDGDGRFRRWQPKKKNVGKGGSSSSLSNRQQQRNESHQRSSSQQQPKEDVGPFVKAVCSLGFEHVATDGANRMFVVMTFTRSTKKVDKNGSQKKRRRRDHDDEDEGGRGRLVGGRGGWPSLRPCSYKKR